MGAGEGEGGVNWESSTETYTLRYVQQIWSLGAPTVLCDYLGGGEGGSRGRGHMYTYDWFILLYGRNQRNIVKQLSSN